MRILVADDDLQARCGFVGGQQQGADVVQEGEIAEQHAGHAGGAVSLAGQGDTGGRGDRAVDAGEAPVGVHGHPLAPDHLIGHAHQT